MTQHPQEPIVGWLKDNFLKLYHSVWLFPVLGLLVLIVLTSFKISGTSAGIYYKNFYGGGAKDPNLIFGQPRLIRSDEWEWQTLMAAAQVESEFPKINTNIGLGQDMGAIVDVPYRHWTVLFKPQNLAFFVLPFEYAFAFKWWLLSFLLVVSSYFFILVLLPKRRLLAALLSLAFLFSPFIQWWYQTITLAPLFYSFFIAIAIIKLWQSRRPPIQAVWILLLSYLLICFAAVLYPPFQIPCALVTAVFLIGYFIERGWFKNKKIWLRGLKLTAISLAFAGLGIVGFVAVNKTSITATKNSIYPGKRVGVSGNFDVHHFFSNFLDSHLQLTRKAKHYVANQSEAANFLLLAPFLTLPILYMLGRERRSKKPIDWPLLAVSLLFIAFMVRLFVPGTDWFFSLLGLASVPNARLLIGIGLVSFLQLILFLRHSNSTAYSPGLAYRAAIFAALFNLYFAVYVFLRYPGYVNSLPVAIILALIPPTVVLLLGLRKIYPAAGLLLGFSIISAGIVNPIYHGTGALIDSDLSRKVAAIGRADPDHKWAVADDVTLENLPALSNVGSITNTYAYPQPELWTKSPASADAEEIYNRFAHTVVSFKPEPAQLSLKQADFIGIVGSACSPLYRDLQVKYFVALKDYSQRFPCLLLKESVAYPNISFYILELK